MPGSEGSDKMNCDYGVFFQLFVANKLSLNVSKTCYMVFSTISQGTIIKLLIIWNKKEFQHVNISVLLWMRNLNGTTILMLFMVN
jgi:hypothetical protein